jgi:hypothetical protein
MTTEDYDEMAAQLDLLATWVQSWVNTILDPEYDHDDEHGEVLTQQLQDEVDALIDRGLGSYTIIAAVTVAAQARRMYLREKAKNETGETGDD